MPEDNKPLVGQNFIHQFIQEDLAPGGRFAGMLVNTLCPPSRTVTSISATVKLLSLTLVPLKNSVAFAICAWMIQTPPKKIPSL